MTREQKIEMFAMRLDGYTMQEIGDKFNITKERVRTVLQYTISMKNVPKYGYVNIISWLREKHIKQYELAKELGICKGTLTGKLHHNKDANFKAKEIQKILELTGMTYEEAFKFVEKEDAYEKDI